MKRNAKIKVIKKNEVIITKPPIVKAKKLKQLATRELVSTVSEWVSEFQTRRCKEKKQAINQLYTQRLQAI